MIVLENCIKRKQLQFLKVIFEGVRFGIFLVHSIFVEKGYTLKLYLQIATLTKMEHAIDHEYEAIPVSTFRNFCPILPLYSLK